MKKFDLGSHQITGPIEDERPGVVSTMVLRPSYQPNWLTKVTRPLLDNNKQYEMVVWIPCWYCLP